MPTLLTHSDKLHPKFFRYGYALNFVLSSRPFFNPHRYVTTSLPAHLCCVFRRLVSVCSCTHRGGPAAVCGCSGTAATRPPLTRVVENRCGCGCASSPQPLFGRLPFAALTVCRFLALQRRPDVWRPLKRRNTPHGVVRYGVRVPAAAASVGRSVGKACLHPFRCVFVRFLCRVLCCG